MKLSHRLIVVLLAALIGAGLAGSLLLHHHGEASGLVEGICGEGAGSGCDRVNQSAYANVFGLPWAALGLVFFTSVAAAAVIALAASDEVRETVGAALLPLFGLALVFDVWLLFVQAFRIHAYCRLCIATYVVNAVAFAVLWPLRASLSKVGPTLGSTAARVVVAGWLVATAATALGVTAVEAALAERERHRAATVLGDPRALPSPEPAPEPEATPTAPPPVEAAAAPAHAAGSADLKRYEAELKAAQDELKKLRATLDDPNKYEQYQAEKTLSDFAKGPEAAIDLKDVPLKGPADAPIKVVEYSDFLCPFCRSIAHAFTGYVPQTANRVSVHYKFYPLDACNPAFANNPMHPGACWLAFGGVCAQEQGKFWPYHDKVFSLEPQKSPPDRQFVVKLAAELGMDESAFNNCVGSARTRDRVTADINEGTKAGVKGTPSIYINKRRLGRTSEFLQAVEQEAKRLGLGAMPKVQ